MRDCADFIKFAAVAIALGVFANASVAPVFAKERDLIGPASATAIHDCNIDANKFSPITQLSNQFAEYGTCMARHGQPFG